MRASVKARLEAWDPSTESPLKEAHVFDLNLFALQRAYDPYSRAFQLAADELTRAFGVMQSMPGGEKIDETISHVFRLIRDQSGVFADRDVLTGRALLEERLSLHGETMAAFEDALSGVEGALPAYRRYMDAQRPHFRPKESWQSGVERDVTLVKSSLATAAEHLHAAHSIFPKVSPLAVTLANVFEVVVYDLRLEEDSFELSHRYFKPLSELRDEFFLTGDLSVAQEFLEAAEALLAAPYYDDFLSAFAPQRGSQMEIHTTALSLLASEILLMEAVS